MMNSYEEPFGWPMSLPLHHRLHHHATRAGHHLRNAFVPHEGNEYRPHALRHHWLGIYALAIVMVKVGVVAFVAFYASPGQVSDVTPSNIVRLSNDARKANKLAALRSSTLLNKAAQSKANDMVRLHYFAHTSPTGTTPWYFFKQAKYAYRYAGENLAIDFTQSEDVIAAWLKSPSHRRNLLSKNYTEIGVAIARGTIEGVESLVVVQMFGTPVQTATKVSTAPTQTPTVATAKQTVSSQPVAQPVVLGEDNEPDPVPPSTPTVVTPEANSVVRAKRPTVVGQAEPGSEVMLVQNNVTIATAVTDDAGSYALTPETDGPEGRWEFTVIAKARGLSSQPTAARSVTIDSQPPALIEAGSYVLPSPYQADSYDVGVKATDDATSVKVLYGPSVTTLEKYQGRFIGHVVLPAKSAPGSLRIVATDTAGNEIATTLSDPELATIGVVESRSSRTAVAIQLIFFSRSFLVAFLVFLLALAVINLVVKVEHHHHPTLLSIMALMYLTAALLFV